MYVNIDTTVTSPITAVSIVINPDVAYIVRSVISTVTCLRKTCVRHFLKLLMYVTHAHTDVVCSNVCIMLKQLTQSI